MSVSVDWKPEWAVQAKIRDIKRNTLPVDWKLERATQAKVRDFFQNKDNKTKSMTAEARQCRNTLRWSTNGDFFQTFGSTMGFVPKRHQLLPSTGFYPVCSPIYSQKHHLQGSLPMFVLQCRSTSHLTYFVSFHRVHPSYATIQSSSHLQFVQSYKSHSFMHSYNYTFVH